MGHGGCTTQGHGWNTRHADWHAQTGKGRRLGNAIEIYRARGLTYVRMRDSNRGACGARRLYHTMWARPIDTGCTNDSHGRNTRNGAWHAQIGKGRHLGITIQICHVRGITCVRLRESEGGTGGTWRLSHTMWRRSIDTDVAGKRLMWQTRTRKGGEERGCWPFWQTTRTRRPAIGVSLNI